MEKNYYLKTKEDELLSFKNIHELYAHFGGMFEHILDNFCENTIADRTITLKEIEDLFMNDFVKNWNTYTLDKKYIAIETTDEKDLKWWTDETKQRKNKRTKQVGNGERNTIL